MRGKKKVVYAVSNINKAAHFEWIAASRLARDLDLSFVLLNPGPSVLETFLRERGVPVRSIRYRGKKDLPRATLELARHFRRERPDLVHAHLLDASLAALTAARLAGVPDRVYTRHHSNLHHVRYPHGVYYDRAINFLATRIIATCDNVRRVLTELEGVPEDKISVIHFGFELERFRDVSPARVAALRAKHGLDGKGPVIGAISRYMKYKGLQHVIPAFERLRRDHPGAVLFLANTSGSEHAETIRGLLAALPAGSYREVPFEEDFAALYGLFDVFVHAPIDGMSEAFGQVYPEALAAGVPSVFTLSGVASEFVRHERNALVVPYGDPEAIHAAVSRLLADSGLRQRLTAQGREDVQRLFPLEGMIEKLGGFYA